MSEERKVVDAKQYDTDNRDLTTTLLVLIDDQRLQPGDAIEIDPVEMFRNALENAGMSSTEVSIIIDQAMSRIDEINNQE